MIARAIVIVLAVQIVALCRADDGWVGNGGTPSTLNGKHKTIRMMDEVVRIHVGKNYTTVDCLFHFKNSGPATSVRMGFPDHDSLREDASGSKTSVFKKYRSWVDNKRVKCKFEGTKENGYWQTKTVSFAAGEGRTIRDHYDVSTGSGDETGKYYMHYADYILSTGGTWNGSIGRVEIIISFDPDLLHPAKLVPSSAFSEKVHAKSGVSDEDKHRLDRAVIFRNKRTVFWHGPKSPTLKNGIVRFFARDLNPSNDDNISLIFAPFVPKF